MNCTLSTIHVFISLDSFASCKIIKSRPDRSWTFKLAQYLMWNQVQSATKKLQKPTRFEAKIHHASIILICFEPVVQLAFDSIHWSIKTDRFPRKPLSIPESFDILNIKITIWNKGQYKTTGSSQTNRVWYFEFCMQYLHTKYSYKIIEFQE